MLAILLRFARVGPSENLSQICLEEGLVIKKVECAFRPLKAFSSMALTTDACTPSWFFANANAMRSDEADIVAESQERKSATKKVRFVFVSLHKITLTQCFKNPTNGLLHQHCKTLCFF